MWKTSRGLRRTSTSPKIRSRALGFKPAWNLEKGVRQIYESFRNRPLTFEDFDGHMFIRLKHLKHLIENGKLDESLHWVNRINYPGTSS